MSGSAPVRVGIGLIERGGSYLIRRRPEGSTMAGVWEFPGGKVETGESPSEATARECWEEVGLPIEVGPLVRRIVHQYSHGLVELFYYQARSSDPDAEPAPETGFRWVHASDLPSYTFPEANDELIASLAATVEGP